MVRLTDLHPEEAESMSRVGGFDMAPGPWITPKPLTESTIALLTTSGLHRRDDPPFLPGALDYRLIPANVDFSDLVVSHISTNWDRSALQQDPNVVLPLDRLHELAAAGEIGNVANWHYSFMGGVPEPQQLESSAREVGRMLRRDGVDAVVLVPV